MSLKIYFTYVGALILGAELFTRVISFCLFPLSLSSVLLLSPTIALVLKSILLDISTAISAFFSFSFI